MAPQTVLVIGATGQQGGSVITSLLSLSPTIQILALTRNLTSSTSLRLAKDPQIRLVYGSPSSPSEIFSQTGPVDSVFCVTVHGKPGFEENQAERLIDESLTNGVNHFVFTSADRGGAELSEVTETNVPHIATKYRIEKYLKEKTSGTQMGWTILRPVTFFDNLTPDFPGKGFAKMWEQVGEKGVQMVSVKDIGYFAAKALLNPEVYKGKCVGIAGDELNFEEAKRQFKEVIGKEMPQTFCVVGKVLRTAMPDLGAMFKWFEKEGFNVDIREARREYPGLKNFKTWLREESGFVEAAKSVE